MKLQKFTIKEFDKWLDSRFIVSINIEGIYRIITEDHRFRCWIKNFINKFQILTAIKMIRGEQQR